MSTQTRNKRKDWQAGLGIKAHKVVCQRPLSGLSVTVKWALGDQVSGIERTSNGHSLPVRQALSAQSVGWFLGTSCGSAAPLLCVMLYGDFVMLRWRFLWYFYQNHDTFMILFCKIYRKSHFCILLCVWYLYQNSAEKMVLWDFFHEKTFFVCV